MTLLLLNLIVFYLSIVATVFAILNPIGAVPTLMVLTDGYTASEKKRVIFKSIMVASGMILGFMFLGIYIFLVLGIDISDFKVAGGILLFKVAFDMLQGKVSNTKLTPQETQESIDREAVGIVPIGTPLLAGPGTITTAMIFQLPTVFHIRKDSRYTCGHHRAVDIVHSSQAVKSAFQPPGKNRGSHYFQDNGSSAGINSNRIHHKRAVHHNTYALNFNEARLVDPIMVDPSYKFISSKHLALC
jgi:MarC family membrane protein